MFTGFPKEGYGFFHELSIEMNRDWFAENKQRYEALWVEPLQALIAEVAPKLPVKTGEAKILRIYRDVRFSKEKAPYKTHIAARIPTTKGHTAMYLHFGIAGGGGAAAGSAAEGQRGLIDEEWTGGGCYFFDPKQLAVWRKTVAGRGGEGLVRVVEGLRKKGYTVGGFDDYKRIPRPYTEDHPRAALLKQKGLTTSFPEIPRGLLHKPAFAKWLIDHAKAVAPLTKWLDEHIPKSSEEA